ncbi:MAG TPA: hypothetical protein VKC11_00670 [Steroidobacteraceae bacterium]|nr:hypothetical protein [Steroidobacteraceae bacterium]
MSADNWTPAERAERIAVVEWNAVNAECERLLRAWGPEPSHPQGAYLLDRNEDRRRRAILAIMRLSDPSATLADVPVQSGRNELISLPAGIQWNRFKRL